MIQPTSAEQLNSCDATDQPQAAEREEGPHCSSWRFEVFSERPLRDPCTFVMAIPGRTSSHATPGAHTGQPVMLHERFATLAITLALVLCTPWQGLECGNIQSI